MILNVFDFDDTLFRIPSHTHAPKDMDITNIHSWYDHPDSLNDDLYRVQLIETTADLLRLYMKDVNCVNILITRRVEAHHENIHRLLKKHGLVFDKTFIIGTITHKADTLRNFIDEFNEHERGSFDIINIFEDTLYQIHEYRERLPNLMMNYYFVDKTHMLELVDFKTRVVGKLNLNNQ